MSKDPLKIQFDPEVLDRLRAESEMTGKSMAAIVRLAVSAHLDPPAITDPDVAAVVEAARREAECRGLSVETVLSLWRGVFTQGAPLPSPSPSPLPSTDLSPSVAAIEARALSQPLIRVRPSRRSELRGPANPTLEDQLKMVQTKLAILERRMNEKDGKPEK